MTCTQCIGLLHVAWSAVCVSVNVCYVVVTWQSADAADSTAGQGMAADRGGRETKPSDSENQDCHGK